MKAIFALVVAVFALTACVSIGPMDKKEFDDKLRVSTPIQEGAIKFSGYGNWFPNAAGLPAAVVHTGVVVFTDRGLLFQQWSDTEQKFDVIKKIALSDVKDAKLSNFGLNRALVVRSRDYDHDMFNFNITGTDFIDREKATLAHRHLQDAMSKQRD